MEIGALDREDIDKDWAGTVEKDIEWGCVFENPSFPNEIAAEAEGQRRAGAHRREIDVEQELRRLRIDRDRALSALGRPEHRAHVELGLGPETAHALVHQLQDLVRGLGRLQS